MLGSWRSQMVAKHVMQRVAGSSSGANAISYLEMGNDDCSVRVACRKQQRVKLPELKQTRAPTNKVKKQFCFFFSVAAGQEN